MTNKKKKFYSEVVDFSGVFEELATIDATDNEKRELLELAHDHLHQTILDAILSELSDRDKKIFLANLEYESEERIWKHLNEKVENIEEKIKTAADNLGVLLKKDIKNAKTS